MSAPAPSAWWSTRDLLCSLTRAGWGELAPRSAQGLRAVLGGLVLRLPYKSGQGCATVAQIAAASGRGVRRTADMLAELERRGLIEWRRGFLDRRTGRRVPGFVRIIKSALVALIKTARGRPTRKRAATGTGHNPRSAPPAISADLLTWGMSTRAGPAEPAAVGALLAELVGELAVA